ncbi:MAG: ABC transporter permease [Corynebacterium sp.]|uniref:ABC transporter permease n=1 Tax=uncultured Corynebacterium sp. TaxID=159447 RepID=UPI00185CEEC8|nr:ABC transporter permease [uncultured Corynebacterium sp.]NMB21941.1 ABC transporter permease [Corynebacterium sp.]
MFLAWRDMLFARTRFLLMGLVLGLMSILIVIISGLTAGLVNDGVSGLKALDADVIAFEDGTQTDSAFTRSVVNLDDTDTLAAADGVEEATPMGLSLINARNQEGTPIDLTLVGVEPDSFIAPEGLPAINADRVPGQPTTTTRETIVSGTLEDAGISIGDTITVDRLETEFVVTGFTDDQRTFGHVDLAYVPLDTWQEVHAGARAGEAPADYAYEQASVIVAKASGTDTDALSADTGLDVRTLEESFGSSPGYTAETMTLSMIEWFLYIITALVTGAFFLVWTIQRSADIAVMRAIGATRGFLLRDSLGQAVVILALSILVGVSLAVGLGLWLETTPMPFSTEWGSVLGGAAMLFVSGLIGAFIAVYRVTRTDPLSALGENR